MVKFERCLGFAAAALVLSGVAVGCGSDGGHGSYGSIAAEIAKPTGTVDENTVAKVGEKFETASKSTAQGVRDDDQVGASGSVTVTTKCDAGGSITINGRGNESSARATTNWDHCCLSEGCCATGNATGYYTSDENAAYTVCTDYDMDYSCGGTSAAIEFSGCLSASGLVMLLEVDGASYAVTGSRANGTGSLEIAGANGKWTCTFNAGSGSCSSTAGSSFTFTKG